MQTADPDGVESPPIADAHPDVPDSVSYRLPPPVSYQAFVRKVFTNSVGKPVFYRRGWWYPERPKDGFGYDKIFWKHSIKNNQVVAAPIGGRRRLRRTRVVVGGSIEVSFCARCASSVDTLSRREPESV